MALVSDTAASALTVELLKLTCRRVAEACARRGGDTHGDVEHGDDRSVLVCSDGDDAAAAGQLQQLRREALEQRGVLVGLRLSERLLCRAPVFARGSALDAARFVAYALWRAMYGKKMDVVKHLGSVYELTDKDLHWLQGFPRQPDATTTAAAATMTTNSGATAATTTSTAAATAAVPARSAAVRVTRSDVLVYLVSIVKAAVYTLVGDALDVVVEASNTTGNEVHMVLDFRA